MPPPPGLPQQAVFLPLVQTISELPAVLSCIFLSFCGILSFTSASSATVAHIDRINTAVKAAPVAISTILNPVGIILDELFLFICI
jgi:hypothetical protein